MKTILTFTLTILTLSACTDIKSLNRDYDDTCRQFGAKSSVYCRDLNAQIYIEVLKIKIQEIEDNKEKIVSNQGIEKYQSLINQGKDMISKIESKRPSLYQKIFKRWDPIPPIDLEQ